MSERKGGMSLPCSTRISNLKFRTAAGFSPPFSAAWHWRWRSCLETVGRRCLASLIPIPFRLPKLVICSVFADSLCCLNDMQPKYRDSILRLICKIWCARSAVYYRPCKYHHMLDSWNCTVSGPAGCCSSAGRSWVCLILTWWCFFVPAVPILFIHC